MKGKINVRKVISYLLMFTLIFSTFQLGNMSVSYAESESDTTFVPEIILKADENILKVDKKGSNYVVELINMGTSSFTIQGATTSDGKTWEVTSVACTNSGMTGKISGSGAQKKYTYSNITNYSDFTFTIDVVDTSDSTNTKTYKINMSFEIESLLQFNKLRVSDASNVSNFVEVGYNDVTDGYYRVEMDSDVEKVKIQLFDDNSDPITTGLKVNGSANNTVDITGGDNEITITITKNNVSKEYKLIVTKKGQPLLKSLVPSTGSLSPTFDSETYDYTISVPTATTSIAFTPTSIDNSSTIKVDGVVVKSGRKSSLISLDEGSNKINIVVVTKEGATSTYTVEVNREEAFRSSYLKSLRLSSGTLSPTFNKEVLEYDVSVENSITSINVTPTAEDTNAEIRVEGKKVPSGATSKYINLDEGANKITIKVTDDKGNSSTYILNVSRKYGKDNVNLSSLSLTDGKLSPKFNPETYAYSATVDKTIDKVRVKFTCQNEKAKIVINDKQYVSGQESDSIKLDIGANLITVKVIAENNKTTTTYKISVIRGDIEGKNDWILVAGEWTFYNGYGQQVKNQWVKYDNKWYHLDINGHMEKGWLKIGDKWYFLNEYGIMQTGWLYEKGYWYYLYGDGSMARNSWITLNGNWYLFNDLGEMQTGWTLFGGRWYFLNDKGVMQKGWITYDKNKYYLNDDGTMRNGWIFTGTTWYYLDSTGKMVTGWQTINGKRYYFDAKGAMKTGMIFLDGRWINLNNI